ncbi:MAG TPA: tyrosine-protein phosphatase [Pyrinomonadaceae bacterium]|nr:tyrosine-protein phosphatase [Pyrinomonadaceae bacterium]
MLIDERKQPTNGATNLSHRQFDVPAARQVASTNSRSVLVRSTKPSYLSVLLGVIALVFAVQISAFSQESQKVETSNVTIKNFGQMDDRFFRGGQPKENDYQQLAALGIKTVVDLRDNPTDYEKRDVEALGMKYVNIPMSDKDYPETAKINQFLKLVDDPATGKFYVHCAGGRHRTGVMGAVYRFNHYNWNYDQVYAEMKKYDFYTRWGHGDMKKFVEDYAANFASKQATATVTTTAAGNQK